MAWSGIVKVTSYEGNIRPLLSTYADDWVFDKVGPRRQYFNICGVVNDVLLVCVTQGPYQLGRHSNVRVYVTGTSRKLNKETMLQFTDILGLDTHEADAKTQTDLAELVTQCAKTEKRRSLLQRN